MVSTGQQPVIPLIDDSAFVASALPARAPGEWRCRGLVIGLASLLFLTNLGAFGLWDPWETHYGAVTTHMIESHDWTSPWWGYPEVIGSEPRQGNHFFSKPIFIFWTEAMTSRVLGRGEWSIRLPMALLAILAVFMTYLSVSRIWTRRTGLLAALVTATAPQFFMISRQAQTDMPFVATMTIALSFLALAFFAPRQRRSDRSFWAWTIGVFVFALLNTIPQYGLLWLDMESATDLRAKRSANQILIWIGLLALSAIWYGYGLYQDWKRQDGSPDAKQAVIDKWIRRHCMMFFYIFVAQSSCAKGLLGFALPGLIILVYLIVSRTWRLLARVELIRGIALFAAVCFPWYSAMFTLHPGAFWTRFFVHDHINRLGAGVHQIDSGTFEHFIKWLGIGMFPWAVFVPLTLVWLMRQRIRDMSGKNQAKLFYSVWFICAFALFTISATKFHHYIFPAMPALAVLTSLFILHLVNNRDALARFATVIGVIFLTALVWDLHEDPQHIRNLMTYKYDRPMPEDLPINGEATVHKDSELRWKDGVFWRHTSDTLHSILTTEAFHYENWIKIIGVLALIALGLFFFVKTRQAGLVALGATASMLALWSLNFYMPSLAPHWSQKYLFDSYYDTCTRAEIPEEVAEAYTPWLVDMGLEDIAKDVFRYENKVVCEEDVISWLITWRGETYYSYNELQPITKEKPQFLPYLEERNHGKKFYALMERNKMSGFKSKLETYSKKLKRQGSRGWKTIDSWDVKVECDESKYFQMISATPVHAGTNDKLKAKAPGKAGQ